MTPIIDKYLFKIRIYKLTLVLFLTLNVFSICAASVIGYRYFRSEKSLARNEMLSLEQLKSIYEADTELTSFELKAKNWPSSLPKQMKVEQFENLYAERIQAWQKLRFKLELIRGLDKEALTPILSAETLGKSVPIFRSEISRLQTSQIASLHKSIVEKASLSSTMIWIGTFTLLFGIILPFAILYFISKTIRHLRLEMQASAIAMIKAWAETKAAFGDTAFRNVDFWLQVLLLATQQGSRFSQHPLAQIAGELALLVREELKKKAA